MNQIYVSSQLQITFINKLVCMFVSMVSDEYKIDQGAMHLCSNIILLGYPNKVMTVERDKITPALLR